MGLWIAIAVLAVAVTAIAVAVMKRRSGSPMPDTIAPPVVAPTPPTRRDPVAMTDLESALAAATDSSGTPIADRIDAEGDHVDELRVPDDTGPLLRRALDHVSPAEEDPRDADDTDRV